MTETATAANPTEATASIEAPETLLATASTETGTTQQTQTTQPEPVKPAETPVVDATKTGTAETPVVPEKYVFTAPEGTEYDPAVLESYTGAAKDAGLTQDAAQKLIDKMAPALAARQADQVQAIHKEWLNASSADKEFGGEKLTENLGVARKALENFGSPELRSLLDETGLGNHPEVIRFMYRAGKAISEDKFVGGRSGTTAATTAAGVLYDKTPQKG